MLALRALPFILLTAVLHAQSGGPLTPPGAPGQVYKTLDEVEPRTPLVDGNPGVSIDANGTVTISQSGSYYLIGNVVISGGTGNGIDISASDVSLDLAGFSVAPSAASTGTGINISGGGALRRVSVRNGAIAGFNIGLNIKDASVSLLTDLQFNGNNTTGVRIDAVAGRTYGIAIERCQIEGGQFGILSNILGELDGLSIKDCVLAGDPAIIGATGGVIFALSGGGALSNLTMRSTTVANYPGAGIQVSAFFSSTATRGVSIKDCTLTAVGFGITIERAEGVVVRDCQITNYTNTGLRFASTDGLKAVGNALRSATPTGIFSNAIEIVGGQGCRIEENTIRDPAGGNGIVSASSTATNRNLILRNSVSGSFSGAAYQLDTDDLAGPIVTGSGTLGSTGAATHPWANFSY